MKEDRKSLLKERARTLAKVAASPVPAPAGLEVIVFTLANESYGLEAEYVREVCPPMEVTRLPCTPAFVAGVINVRGDILAVIDLSAYFGLPASGVPATGEVIITQVGDSLFGVLTDTVIGLSFIPHDDLKPPERRLEGRRESSLKGISTHRVGVLDISRMLADQKLWVHEEVDI